jgi:hypothetical protein
MVLIGVPVAMACALGISLLIEILAVRTLVLLAPDNVFFCTPTHYATLVLVLVGLLLSMPIGHMIANLVLWIVPPIRSALEQTGRSFMRAQSQLAKVALYVSLFLVPIYLIALSSNVCVSDSEIYYRPNIFFPLGTYGVSQITEVRPRCTKGRGGRNIELEIAMNDASLLDLAAWPFFPSSERILALLRNVPQNARQVHHDCPVALRKLITP